MKNITVSVDDDTYHRSRVRAAEMRTSVSALVKNFLKEVAGEETESDRLRRQERETITRIQARLKGFSAGNRLTRQELHDRNALH